jgi:hypothetical protein
VGREGGLGQKAREDSDDVAVYGHREREGKKRRKKIGARIGDTTGNDEEWVNRKSKSSFFLIPACKVK